MFDWLWTDSGYFTLAIALLAMGVLLLLWGWVGQRARGRPRCRRCGYSLAGSPTLACPECGRAHRDLREALRPRRYWKRAALGLALAAVASYALFWPDIAHRRTELKEPWYIAIVPTAAWITLISQLTADQVDMLDARLFGPDAAYLALRGGVGYNDEDGKIFIDQTEYRKLTEIDRIPAWQRRLLATRCIALLNEPLPDKATLESKDPAVAERVWDVEWKRMNAIHWLASVRNDDADAMPAVLRQATEKRFIGWDEQIAMHVLSAAGDPSPELVEVLARHAAESDGRSIQLIIVESFTRIRDSDPRIIAALKPLMEYADERIREPVLAALGNLRPVTPELIALLRGQVMRRANRFDPSSIRAMAALGPPAIPRLIEDLRRLPDPEKEPYRHYLVPAWVLEEMGAAALPAILDLMDEDELETSRRAMEFLEQNTKLTRDALPLLNERLERKPSQRKTEALRRAIKEAESRR